MIQARLARAAEEAEYMDRYDYLVVNDDLESCVEELHGIIRAEHARAARNREFIHQIKKELEEFQK